MAGLEHDLCFDQYEQCRTLYEQDKYTECTHLGLQNMKDHNMPRYLQIKTLILLVGAENDSWHKAEGYRLRAEKVYALTKQIAIDASAYTTAATKAQDEAGFKKLREDLDNMLEYQANEAPRSISLKNAHYPEREGSLVDFLFARRMLEDDSENEAMDEGEGEGEDTEEDEKMKMGEEAAEAEMPPLQHPADAIQLEDPAAVDAADEEVFGMNQNLIQKLREVQLEDQQKEDVSAKETPSLSPKKSVGSLQHKEPSASLRTPKKPWRS